MQATRILKHFTSRRQQFLKNKRGGKGCGNNDGEKKGGPRTCYECDSEEHIAANCQVHAVRVEAGGQERLDRPDDPMKGVKSGGKKGGKKGDKDALKGWGGPSEVSLWPSVAQRPSLFGSRRFKL